MVNKKMSIFCKILRPLDPPGVFPPRRRKLRQMLTLGRPVGGGQKTDDGGREPREKGYLTTKALRTQRKWYVGWVLQPTRKISLNSVSRW